ncbi:related to GLO4 - glyoxalase II (hydroxyacylglutathione hydrolase) [Ustilago trichophora]|uniref:hydroxyacylglutathione hydrolase n=1 Tax=Ustilago trichophora TaxID=86804 RepID=A0A5C3DUA4_9BASI|nr:related to GLO4 - glyoxalase II (hydroxyacylglutathione hydrolase) [Ustilago trichophora]
MSLLSSRLSTSGRLTHSISRINSNNFCTSSITRFAKMKIHPVPVRDDNYAYILQSSIDGSALFVDPYDVPAVKKAASALGIKDSQVVGLLTTHHHHDHSGGNEAFTSAYPGRPILGGSDQIPALTRKVADGDEVNDLLKGVQIKCLATPCHTQDHICYFVTDTANQQAKGVFTGDTLFISGCGRFFEGKPEEMLAAMDKLSSLPDETLVYCGHEYTKSNVAFSAAILPESEDAISKLVRDLKEAKNGGVTTGIYTIKDERKHNPFMRCRDEVVQKAAAKHGGKEQNSDPVTIMALLRELKNGGQVKANI